MYASYVQKIGQNNKTKIYFIYQVLILWSDIILNITNFMVFVDIVYLNPQFQLQ